MNEGRLVWHRTWPSGAWVVDSQMYPPDFWYRITKNGGWWVVDVCQAKPGHMLHETERLGVPQRYLRDAKRIADQHHHAQIQAHGDEGIKGYIARYPL